MAKRTYAPQLARMLQRVYAYNGKHAAKFVGVVSAQQQTDLDAIVAAIKSSWLSVPTTEAP
jgi:hypothetical protein